MDEPLSSDEGTESNEFSSLEERIVKTERDHDREVSRSLRLTYWQEAQIQMISNKIGTNKVEVCLRAYTEGLREIREELLEDVVDVTNLKNDFYNIVSNSKREGQRLDDIINDVYSTEIEEDWDRGKLDDPTNVRIRDSVSSESNNKFTDDVMLGSWIHRSLIGIGLGNSENVTEKTKREVKRTREGIRKSIKESRREVEVGIKDYISLNVGYWSGNGIEKQLLNGLEDIVSRMKTEHKDGAKSALTVTDYDIIDVVEGGD